MTSKISITRRDLLKLGLFAPAGAILSKITQNIKLDSSSPNIILIVLDALTARSMSLYGHLRNTTPAMEPFADRSTVYHSHYSGGTFTTAGTSSLLTGMYPWTHRAINVFGMVARKFSERNIFRLLGDNYFRTAFTQNPLADILLSQFGDSIDRHYHLGSFAKIDQYSQDDDDRRLYEKYIYNDDFLYANRPASLIFGALQKYKHEINKEIIQTSEGKDGVGGSPRLYFQVEDVFSGMAHETGSFPAATFAYFHFYPPHEPYLPGPEFENKFLDGWKQPTKPRHALATNANDNKSLNEARLNYERYLARADASFAHFVAELERNGYFENSYIILTSDHGHLFERGIEGHQSPLVYEGGIHIPLVIHSPGQQERKDVFTSTNAVDVLPTLLSITQNEIPDWCEGQILPGFVTAEEKTRNIFTMDAKESSPFGDLKTISVAMRQGDLKLHFYKGFTDYRKADKDKKYFEGTFELYNIINDPEETNNLMDQETAVAASMKTSLLAAYEKSRHFDP